jgi:hypothetical protein
MSVVNDSDDWTVAEGHTGEYPFQVRFRTMRADFPRSDFPKRLNIFWSMSEADDNGYATAAELRKLHTFEDRLVKAVEFDGFSILSVVLTGRSEREFVFYTPDPQEFVQRLTQMPQEEEIYPVEIHANDDEDWEYYENEVKDIQGA